jgi:hypothetical protein
MPKFQVAVGPEGADEVAARPKNLGSAQRLQRFADVHQLHVDELLRVLRAQEELARAVWGTLRAWRGRSSDTPAAVARWRVPRRRVYFLLATAAALATGLPLPPPL